MTSTKPDIVLIHGGWHRPISYAKLTAQLESHGYKVHVPALPTMGGERPAVADLSTDSAFIRSYVSELSDSGISSIVLMHSYGGQVGTNSLVGLGATQRRAAGDAGGVLELVYMCAFAVAEGTSMTAWVESQGHGELMPLAFDFQNHGIVMSRDPKGLVVGADLLPDDEVDEYVATFTTWASKAWEDEIRQCAWREIPVTYIETLRDMTIPHSYQTTWIQNMREASVTVETAVLDTGHCPNVTATEDVVDVLEKVTERIVARGSV